MAKVVNEVVSMDWDAKGFVEFKKHGFIAAVHEYNGVAVAFKEGKIYTHIDDDGSVIAYNDLVKEIERATKKNDLDYPEFFDDYAEIYDGREFSGTENFLNIAEYKEDMLARLEDLSGYWHVIETDTLG